MSKSKRALPGTMLDLWRPPKHAGDAIGCLATTFTFDPALFDEQCLGRFLDIESEPDREDLAFLLERESRLGGVYAGVLVDQQQAGVEHSLRWDVLRVRFRAGMQHSKLSLLVWKDHIRIIVSSANLTEPGYRFNYEVAGTVDLTADQFKDVILSQTLAFLRKLLRFVPGADTELPEVQRAQSFLTETEELVKDWKPARQRHAIRQQLVFTLPANEPNHAASSTLEETTNACRLRGGSADAAWIASPFFDVDDDSGRVTAAFCKSMARGKRRRLSFCVPAMRDADPAAVPRLAAPKSLFVTPKSYGTEVTIEMLPEFDAEKNRRSWHAKMIALYGDSDSALLIGSSNFTGAGMGVGQYRNAEANLLSIVDYSAPNERRQLDSVWPGTEPVNDPDAAEWLGPRYEFEEEEQLTAPVLPIGFLSAVYRAGDNSQLVLTLDPEFLPKDWQVYTCGLTEREVLSATRWRESCESTSVEIAWPEPQPPYRLLVMWADRKAFWPINVEDVKTLLPPAELEKLTADEMLMILAAADPSAAFRTVLRKHFPPNGFDPELDSANPIDLDPLTQHDLQATFLHRVRRRARVLAQVRAKLEQPVYGRRALEWRLRGLLGVQSLADRLVRETVKADGALDEALLTLADFLIVLREVKYQTANGALSAVEFNEEFQSFLAGAAETMRAQIEPHQHRVAKDLWSFWEKVVKQCVGQSN
jgi:hypothetical protein